MIPLLLNSIVHRRFSFNVNCFQVENVTSVWIQSNIPIFPPQNIFIMEMGKSQEFTIPVGNGTGECVRLENENNDVLTC